jgi:hypothetical protein
MVSAVTLSDAKLNTPLNATASAPTPEING